MTNIPITAPKWLLGVIGTVLTTLLLGVLAYLPSAWSEQKISVGISSHNTDSQAHSAQFRAIQKSQNEVINKQTHFQSEISHIKDTQDRLLEGQDETNKILREILIEQRKE